MGFLNKNENTFVFLFRAFLLWLTRVLRATHKAPIFFSIFFFILPFTHGNDPLNFPIRNLYEI